MNKLLAPEHISLYEETVTDDRFIRIKQILGTFTGKFRVKAKYIKQHVCSNSLNSFVASDQVC